MIIAGKRLLSVLEWKELIPVDEWAEQYYQLEPESAIGGGLYNFDYAPYLRLPMQSIGFDNLHDYNFWFASQSGKTTLSMVALNYFIDRIPSNIAFYLPNDNLVPSTSADRILPSIRRTPNAEKIAVEKEVNKLKDNTKIIRYGGGITKVLSGNSAANRKSFPAKYIFIDETSEFNKKHIAEIEERGKTYELFGGKVIKTSTSLTSKDPCVIGHKQADCIMEYYIKCPKCGNEHIDDFLANVKFEELKGNLEDEDFKVEYIKHASRTAYYECPSCKAKWNDKTLNEAVSLGEWKAIRGDIHKDRSVSFRASSLLSFFVPIGLMVSKYLKVKDDDDLLNKFYNGWLSKIFSYKKKQKSHSELLPLINDNPKGEIWEDTLSIVGTVDVQKDHYYYMVMAFKKGIAVHICDYGRVENEIDLQYKVLQGYKDQNDNIQYVEKWAIDSGYDTKNIYDLVEHLNSLNDMAEFDETLKEIFDERQGIPVDVIPIKGASREMNVISYITTIESDINGKKYDDSFKLHTINTKMFKDNAWSYIKRSLDEEYKGEKRLSIHAEADESILKSFVSEQKVEVTNKKGITSYEWIPIQTHPFNHYWDCLVYGLYLGEKLDIRFRQPIIKKIVKKRPPPKREMIQSDYGDWQNEY